MVFLAAIPIALLCYLTIATLFWGLETIYKVVRLRNTVQSYAKFGLVMLAAALALAGYVIFAVNDANDPASIFAPYREGVSFWVNPFFYGLLLGFLAGSMLWDRFFSKAIRRYVGVSIN